jgi:pimeloyl-ACP methyl ester carboxylesterase
VTTILDRIAAARERTAAFAAQFPFEPRFFDVDRARGIAMHYVDEGPRVAAPILFLHGNPTWSFLWRELVRELRGRYRCIAPDHVGCGLSDKPQAYEYRLERHVDNLERLVLFLGLSRITLVVHDWGGAIGFGLATRRPELFERFVVMNTAAFTGGRAPLRIRACRTPLLGAVAVRGFNAFARAALTMATERGLDETVRRGLIAPYGDWEERIATLRFVEDIPLSPSHPSWSELARIESGLAALESKPMCIVWGERDWCFTPAFRREWQRRFPRARVHVAEAAGHWVMEDAREDVVRWVEEFVAQGAGEARDA